MSLSKPSPESDYSLPEHSDSDLFSEDSAFHNQIKQVIFDVEIPDRLKDSILTSLSQNDVSTSTTDNAKLLSRRHFLKKPGVLTALSVCLMFSMMLTYFWTAQAPFISLTEFSPKMNLDSRLLSDFDNNFSERFPVQGGWRFKGGLVFTNKSYGVSVSESSSHDAVVRFFTLPTGGAKLICGALVQVPVDRVEPLPLHTKFDPGTVAYTQLKKGNYATVKWVEDDRVYICIVFGGAREIEAVGRALHSASA